MVARGVRQAKYDGVMRRAAYWVTMSVFLSIFLAGCFHGRAPGIDIGPARFSYTDNADTYYVEYVQYVDRQRAGYTSLPRCLPRYGKKGQPPRGYFFDAWDGRTGRDFFRSGKLDYPHWPDGDPGLGLNNPLPPLVKRVWTLYVDPSILAHLGGLGLFVGGVVGVVRWELRQRRRAETGEHGFGVTLIDATAAPTRRSAPPAPS